MTLMRRAQVPPGDIPPEITPGDIPPGDHPQSDRVRSTGVQNKYPASWPGGWLGSVG